MVSCQKQINVSLLYTWQLILVMFIYHVVTEPFSLLKMVMSDFPRCTWYVGGRSSQASWTTPSECCSLLLGRHVFHYPLISHEHLRRGESEKLLIRGKNTRRTIVSWVSLTINKTRHSCSTLCSMHGRVKMHRGTYMAAVCIWLWMDMLISLHKMDPMFIAKKTCHATLQTGRNWHSCEIIYQVGTRLSLQTSLYLQQWCRCIFHPPEVSQYFQGHD